MHFVVSWNIKGNVTKRKAIAAELKAALAGYSWVRPLPNLYIVRVGSQIDWANVLEGLKAVARLHPKRVNFVASPLMQGGGYRGWLPKDLWPKVSARTKEHGRT